RSVRRESRVAKTLISVAVSFSVFVTFTGFIRTRGVGGDGSGAGASWFGGATLFAQQPATAKMPAEIAVCTPLAAPPGATTRMTLRGWRLDQATDVKVVRGNGTVKLVSKGAAPAVDKFDPKRIGDKQLELDVTVPPASEAKSDSADSKPGVPVVPVVSGSLGVVVVTPDGESAVYELLVGADRPVVAEVEPNDGFRTAQMLTLNLAPGLWVDGAIHANQNVDVFSFEVAGAQRLRFELLSARRGFPMDGQLTVYDQRGAVLGFSDDTPESSDPRLDVDVPVAGRYFVVVQDALDRGGSLYLYRLGISATK
ncbi:MAG TPA: PPC domain-containing protein, partial [Pirellulaceae bacterium]|nr:PPC domain-containing protein [Pirellulaceae bacterium]